MDWGYVVLLVRIKGNITVLEVDDLIIQLGLNFPLITYVLWTPRVNEDIQSLFE